MTTKINNNHLLKKALIMPLLIGALFLFSCESAAQAKKENKKEHVEKKGHDKDGENHGEEHKGHDNDAKHAEGKGHDHDGEGHGSEREGHDNDAKHKEGKEDGTDLGLDKTYDVTKHGVRLVLKYNKERNVFEGYMQNKTNKAVERARVEVHLSNGKELGPTKPITLAAKAKKTISLKATEKSFDGWSTHAEIGNMEHGHGKEGGKGHDGKERKERHGDNEGGGEHN